MTDPRRWMQAAALAALLPGAALAEARAMSGAEIAAALLAHDVVYEQIGWERHEANGRLVSRSVEGPFGRTSVGEWRVEGDARCLRWNRAMDWVCYRVTIEGDTLRFIDAMGNVSTGRLVPR